MTIQSKHVSIRFCGGCNPRIDRGKIAAEIQNELAEAGFTVSFNQQSGGFVIYLSGCQAHCAERYYPTNLANAAIAGETINALPVPKEELARQLVGCVKEHFAQSMRTLSPEKFSLPEGE